MALQAKSILKEKRIATLAIETDWLHEVGQLKDMIESHKGDIKELCDLLGGSNLEKDYFDFNYGMGVYAVDLKNNQFHLREEVDIWEDDGWTILAEGYDFSRVEKIIKKYSETYKCTICDNEENSINANYCKICGTKIERQEL
ncbi:MAG: hypothetical protein GX958_10580 [Desulfitobacterium sp.]|nr:hypothetical protein [Desulfitobacterium sp.]